MARVSPSSSDISSSISGTKRLGSLSQTSRVSSTRDTGLKFGNCSVFTLHHWVYHTSGHFNQRPLGECCASRGNGDEFTFLHQERHLHQDQSHHHDHSDTTKIKYKYSNYGRAMLGLLRVQETALEFLFRWLMLDDSDEDEADHQSQSSNWPSIDNLEPSIWCHSYRYGQFPSSQHIERDTTQADCMYDRRQVSRSGRSIVIRNTKRSSVRGHSAGSSNRKHSFFQHHHHTNPIDLILKDLPKFTDTSWTTVLKYIFKRWLTWTNVCELLLIMTLMSCCAYQCYELLHEYYMYPTHVSVTKVMNSDFRTDLPAVTICDNSRVSKMVFEEDYPELNDTHFMAITLGTFYSVTNYTLNLEDKKTIDKGHNDDNIVSQFADSNNDESGGDSYANATSIFNLLDERNPGRGQQSYPGPGKTDNNDRPAVLQKVVGIDHNDIDWVKVVKFLAKNRVSGHIRLLPKHSLIENVLCSNIWGEKMPCSRLRTLKSVQNRAICETLFHDTVLYDSREPPVKELEEAMLKKPSTIIFGYQKTDNITLLPIAKPTSTQSNINLPLPYWRSIFNLGNFNSKEYDIMMDANKPQFNAQRDPSNPNNQISMTDDEEEAELERNKRDFRVAMYGKEILRLRINFHGSDYANTRNVVGAKFTIHSNSMIGDITHKPQRLLPGRWYSYFIERFDYRRLPPPYDSQCYDYSTSSRSNWLDRKHWIEDTREQSRQLVVAQSKSKMILKGFEDMVRKRSLSRVSSGVLMCITCQS